MSAEIRIHRPDDENTHTAERVFHQYGADLERLREFVEAKAGQGIMEDSLLDWINQEDRIDEYENFLSRKSADPEAKPYGDPGEEDPIDIRPVVKVYEAAGRDLDRLIKFMGLNHPDELEDLILDWIESEDYIENLEEFFKR